MATLAGSAESQKRPAAEGHGEFQYLAKMKENVSEPWEMLPNYRLNAVVLPIVNAIPYNADPAG